MGFDSVQIRVIIRNLPMNSIRLLYRSVCNNPFLVGFVCLLVLLFRSFPFLLSLLVSASPILVCTALLLGTLLSFGQSNIPEIRNIENATVIERDARFTTERSGGLRADVIEKGTEQATCVEKKGCVIGNAFDSVVSNALSVDGKSVDLALEKKMEINEEILETEGMASDVNLEMVTDKSPADSGEAEVGNVESSDDESDRAESSSPDASMADIFPMLDELHPLLDEDAPHPTRMSHDDSDSSSHDDITESDDDSENKGEEVDGDDDEEDEEEARLGNNGFVSSSPITWTEDDHRNVIDIGTSEIERNNRLESLIARMKARKTVSSMESADLTFNVPPVATTRRNPFDDSFNDMGLPPVPGSAPSVILPRQNPFDVPDDSYYGTGLPPIPGSAPANILPGQNPFDIPFDSSDEKPDDSFQEKFSSQERQDIGWRPYFDHMEDQTLNKEEDPRFGQKEVQSTHANAELT